VLLLPVLMLILCLQVVVAAHLLGAMRHSELLRDMHDMVAGLHSRKPDGISHHGWRGLLNEMLLPTGNAINRLDMRRLKELDKTLKQVVADPVTLDTPRTWLEVMKAHAPEYSDYIDMRLEGVDQVLAE